MDRSHGRRSASGVAAALLLGVGLLAGCAGDGPSAPASPGEPVERGYGAPATTGTEETDAGEVVIVISDFSYDLPDAVPAGAQVTVRNEDGVGHTVTSDDGVFDVEVAPGGEAVLTVPDEPGDYPFHCTPDPAMTGTLVVEG